MNKIKKLLDSGIKQRELAESLGISQALVSGMKNGKIAISKRINILIEEIYTKERITHPNKRIEAIIKLLEALPENDIDDIQKSIEEKKLLNEYKNQLKSKAA